MLDTSSHLLVVDDDEGIRDLLADYLTTENYQVTALQDGTTIDHVLSTNSIDLIILDLMLPGEDGLSICRRIRANSSIPIIILTAKGEDLDRIIGIEMGADDYMAKPFNPRELLARIKAIIRRSSTGQHASSSTEENIVSFDGFKVNYPIRQVLGTDGVQIHLSGKEFDLLFVLINHARKILSRTELMEMLESGSQEPEDRSIDMLVARLRKKLEADPKTPQLIKTIRGTGYIFTPLVEAV
jgi:two-component system OmpR family response regulator